jgi:hypothetical protein
MIKPDAIIIMLHSLTDIVKCTHENYDILMMKVDSK